MKRLFIAGVVIWSGATLALRIAGQWVLNPDRPLSIIALLAVSGLLLFRLPRLLFSRFAIPQEQYALGGIVLVAPGMLLDTVSTICFSSVFPNIRPDAAGLFGGTASGVELAPAVDLKLLHAKIGELALENDFLSGALSKVGLLSAKR